MVRTPFLVHGTEKLILGRITLATLGARLFKVGPRAVDVGCIITAGYDFAESAIRLLESWGMTLLLVRDPEKPCTRGLLQYEDDAFSRGCILIVTDVAELSLRLTLAYISRKHVLVCHSTTATFTNPASDFQPAVCRIISFLGTPGRPGEPSVHFTSPTRGERRDGAALDCMGACSFGL